MVKRLSSPQPQPRLLACETVARRRFKSRNLNRIHLNAVKEERVENVVMKENAPSVAENSAVKDRKTSPYAPRNHHTKHHVHHHHHQNPGYAQRQQRQHHKSQSEADSTSSSSPLVSIHPQNQKISASQKVEDRKKDRRLQGSDLYVARLCWKTTKSDEQTTAQPTTNQIPHHTTPPPHSLHDELCSPTQSTPISTINSPEPPSQRPTAALSKPCYRCLHTMHSAGIKRVFWTNTKGEWEGAKVQGLVDALEGAEGAKFAAGGTKGSSEGENGGGKGGMFVTKHEVLRLRKMLHQRALGPFA